MTVEFKVGQRVIDTPSDDHGEIVASCVDDGGDCPDCWAVKFDTGAFAHVIERDLEPE